MEFNCLRLQKARHMAQNYTPTISVGLNQAISRNITNQPKVNIPFDAAYKGLQYECKIMCACDSRKTQIAYHGFSTYGDCTNRCVLQYSIIQRIEMSSHTVRYSRSRNVHNRICYMRSGFLRARGPDPYAQQKTHALARGSERETQREHPPPPQIEDSP